MKSIAIFSTLLGMLLLQSCSKTKDAPSPGPDPVTPTHFSLQFKPSIVLAAGEQMQDYEFIISLNNNQDEPVLVDKKLALLDSGGLYAAKLELQRGTYRLTKFLLARKTGRVLFASPIAGSQKAQLVTQPLSMVVTNGQTNLKVQEVQLLPVNPNDRESFFGYPDGIFNLPLDPNEPEPATRKLKVHPVVRIGDVVYDSIPTSLQLYTWDQQNNVNLLQFSSPGGIHEITLAPNVRRFRVRMSKWASQSELELTVGQLEETRVYKLEIVKAPQPLRELLTYKMVNNNWAAIEKVEYKYDAAGRQKQTHAFS
ncbi:MAG: hypothetical protein NVV59_08785 [Chitinophagaceae bacterium]|nr:hypothetical protein [Chitinophagaceae bacterium]